MEFSHHSLPTCDCSPTWHWGALLPPGARSWLLLGLRLLFTPRPSLTRVPGGFSAMRAEWVSEEACPGWRPVGHRREEGAQEHCGAEGNAARGALGPRGEGGARTFGVIGVPGPLGVMEVPPPRGEVGCQDPLGVMGVRPPRDQGRARALGPGSGPRLSRCPAQSVQCLLINRRCSVRVYRIKLKGTPLFALFKNTPGVSGARGAG